MKSLTPSYATFSVLGKYRMRSIFYIAVFWTLTDIIIRLLGKEETLSVSFNSFLIREVAVFFMSSIMGYLFVFTLKNVFK